MIKAVTIDKIIIDSKLTFWSYLVASSKNTNERADLKLSLFIGLLQSN